MRSLPKIALVAGTALAGWIAWGIAVTRSATAIPYASIRSVNRVELRRYPETVRVETTAPNERTAFLRLYRYLRGANADAESLSMTTPVETSRGSQLSVMGSVRSEPIHSPWERGGEEEAVRADETETQAASPRRDAIDAAEPPGTGETVRMSVFLPPSSDSETAPVPTDSAVSLAVDPPKTVAALRFSWYAPAWRVARLERRLLRTVAGAGLDPIGEPSLFRYDDPMTPPFMRRNEVAVEIATGEW